MQHVLTTPAEARHCLVAQLREAALATADAPPGDQFEVEMRLGTVACDRRTRPWSPVNDADRPHEFVGAIDELRWRATFARLVAADATVEVSDVVVSTHERYAVAPYLRCEFVDGQRCWVEKMAARALSRDMVLREGRPWCDVRLAVARESPLEAAPPWYRAARVPPVPDEIRYRRRRSVRLPGVAPGWRVDFTLVDATSGLGSCEGARQWRDHELELELERPSTDSDADARAGMALLQRVVHACGRRDADFRRLVQERCREIDMTGVPVL